MFKYAIFANNYKKSTKLVNKIIKILQFNKLKEDFINMKYVFIIGGDGTLLRAVNKFQNIIDKIYFIVIKSGSLGFYSNYNKNNYNKAIKAIINNCIDFKSISLLEIKYNNIINYALNEIKIIDYVNTLDTNIYINNNLLEHFRGSGLVFATKTGSTGYIKSINGSIIATNISTLWQLKEIAPIINSNFYTINTSIILDKNQKIKLIKNLKGKNVIIDTYKSKILNSCIEIKISKKKLKLCYDKENSLNLTTKIKLLFSHCNKKNKR